jgi:hypothetical protein
MQDNGPQRATSGHRGRRVDERRHVGTVQRWATGMLRARVTPGRRGETDSPAQREELLDWGARGAGDDCSGQHVCAK